MREIESIYQIVCKYCGEDIATDTRKKHIVLMRYIFFKLCREITEASQRAIAEKVGREHASVIHGCNQHEIYYVNPWTRDSRYIRAYDKCYSAAIKILDRDFKDQLTTEERLAIELTEAQEQYRKLEVAYEEIKGVTIGDEAELKVVNLFRELSEKEKGEALMQIETKVKVSKTRQTA